ncbi:hypothetical protein RRF57_000060 [Xylaria bambusicola]|uniref:Uncharacterized protein n=1 Tax=Xylaria bambusicola TaxID=326684 RepID=A0AAN7UDN4_9PEZI
MARGADVATIAALSAASGAAATRRNAAAWYNNQGVYTGGFNAASYMNHLRAPAHSRMPPIHGSGHGGVGIHIHYQDPCSHGMSRGSHYPGDILTSRSDGNECPRAHHNPRPPYYTSSPSSPCGCPRCYWREFLTNDIEKYKATRESLRETYIWNLRELVRRHRAAPTKSRAEKDSELEKLY